MLNGFRSRKPTGMLQRTVFIVRSVKPVYLVISSFLKTQTSTARRNALEKVVKSRTQFIYIFYIYIYIYICIYIYIYIQISLNSKKFCVKKFMINY